jgi:hypothetical protein
MNTRVADKRDESLDRSRDVLMKIVIEKCKHFCDGNFNPEIQYNLSDLEQMQKKCIALINSARLLNESRSDYKMRIFLQNVQKIIKNIEYAYVTQVDSLVHELLSEFLQEITAEEEESISSEVAVASSEIAIVSSEVAIISSEVASSRVASSRVSSSEVVSTACFLDSPLSDQEEKNLLKEDLPVEYKQVENLIKNGLIHVRSKRSRDEDLFSMSSNKKVLSEEELKKLTNEKFGYYLDTGFTLNE